MSFSARARARRSLVIAAAVLGVMLVLPASGLAVKKFGAKLRNNDGTVVQPSNSIPAHSCKDDVSSLSNGACTRVAFKFENAVQGHRKAPRDGTLKKIQVVAGGPGHFTAYLARARHADNGGRARVRKKGPQIDYDGSTGPYEIESFHWKVKVRRGDYLAITSKKTSAVRCTSGGERQLLFQPPLALHQPFEHSDGTEGCTLLLQAVYRG